MHVLTYSVLNLFVKKRVEELVLVHKVSCCLWCLSGVCGVRRLVFEVVLDLKCLEAGTPVRSE